MDKARDAHNTWSSTVDKNLEKEGNEDIFKARDSVDELLNTKDADNFDAKVQEGIRNARATFFNRNSNDENEEDKEDKPQSAFAESIMGVFSNGFSNGGLFRRGNRGSD